MSAIHHPAKPSDPATHERNEKLSSLSICVNQAELIIVEVPTVLRTGLFTTIGVDMIHPYMRSCRVPFKQQERSAQRTYHLWRTSKLFPWDKPAPSNGCCLVIFMYQKASKKRLGKKQNSYEILLSGLAQLYWTHLWDLFFETRSAFWRPKNTCGMNSAHKQSVERLSFYK